MRTNSTGWAPALLPFLLAACGGAQATNLAKAVIDTMPGGAIRVSSPGPTAWTDSAGASLIEEGRFQGEDGTPGELGEPQSLAVDEMGRVYVVDRKPASIKVFSPDGKLIRTLGREGEGPGEFRVGFIAVRNGFLVLHDPRTARTSVWDTAGTFLRGWHTSCCYWSDIQLDRQNRIYVPSMSAPKEGERPRGTPYVRWTLEGVALDTVWVPRQEGGKYWTVSVKKGGKNQAMMMTGIPFMPTLVNALRPDGGVVYGWTGDYQVVESLTGKDTVRIFSRAWTPEPVTDERRRNEVESRIKGAGADWGEENIRNAFKLDDVPSTLPAFMNLRVDESGRVWVRRIPVADTTRSYFDVFDSTGAFLGPVTIPLKINDYGMQAWTRDGLVTVIDDEEGRPTVVRLRLGMGGKGK